MINIMIYKSSFYQLSLIKDQTKFWIKMDYMIERLKAMKKRIEEIDKLRNNSND